MKQPPQLMLKGITTRSPGEMWLTSLPTSSTTPIGSWPTMSPSDMKGVRTSYRCRSEPQMPVDVTRMMASVGSSIFGSGTSSTDTFRLPCHVTAFMRSSDRRAGLAPRCSRRQTACPRAATPSLCSSEPHRPLSSTGLQH